MSEKDTFIVPPISPAMRRRLEEAVGREPVPPPDEPPTGRDEEMRTAPTYFAWLLRA